MTHIICEYVLHSARLVILSFLSVSYLSHFVFAFFCIVQHLIYIHLPVVYWRLYTIHFCISHSPCHHSTPSVFFPLALAPVYIQIHRAASVRRLSDLTKACSSICPFHSAPNHLALLCRPSKTGEHPEETCMLYRALNRRVWHDILFVVVLVRIETLTTSYHSSSAVPIDGSLPLSIPPKSFLF